MDVLNPVMDAEAMPEQSKALPMLDNLRARIEALIVRNGRLRAEAAMLREDARYYRSMAERAFLLGVGAGLAIGAVGALSAAYFAGAFS